jgi:hypothetical protein
MLFFRLILPIVLLETNRYMEQVFTAMGKTLPPTQEIFMNDLLAFLARYSDGSRPQAQHQVILGRR